MGNDFKQQIYSDFENVLLNTEEFGRVCSWNGYPLQIAEDARVDLGEFYEAQGVNLDKRKIYCRDTDLTPKPKPTEQVNFDGAFWTVLDVKNPFSYLVITLTRNVA
jgi:hypothetical protein